MANNNSLEFQVSLGLQTAQSQIENLHKLLESSVDVKSSAFDSINRALNKTLTQVSKLKAEMNTAFQTSAGTKRFLKDFDNLFTQIATAGERFGTLGEKDLIFPQGATDQIKKIRSELNQVGDTIKRIEAGKVGKLFEDDSVDAIKKVREVANDLSVDLSKTTFQSFSQKIDAAMQETRKEIKETEDQLKKLTNTANNASLSKDSIINTLTSSKAAESVTSSVLRDKSSAEKLKADIANVYKDFGITADAKTWSSSIKANNDIKSIFVKQEEVITTSTEDLKKVIETKRKEIADAVQMLETLSKTDRDSEGNRVAKEGKLEIIDRLKEQFSSINLSDISKGQGIRAYIQQIIDELNAGANELSTEKLEETLREKINDAVKNATTKDVITDTKAFGDKVSTVLTNTFGGSFNIDFSKYKGSDVTDAFENIAAIIKSQIQNIDTTDLENKLQSARARLLEYSEAQKTVKDTEQADSDTLDAQKEKWRQLAEEIVNVVLARRKIVTNDVSNTLKGDEDAFNKTKTALEEHIQGLDKLNQRQQALSNVSSTVQRWMGFYQVLNLTKRAVNEMKQHIQELDNVMTQIAVVTSMTQSDLWGQISQYSEIARQYGVAIKGVYEVSQIYYQQGLNKGDVMGLTTETLKMARIAGIDYATAADYMTTAVRGFKLEMSEAAHVTDVFSALAASTASSTEELATAISKTAASAESVGASFESTSAMMATMIATTRESATNIGTALKSIISRYGEMSANPEGIDSEGEDYSLNKVDTALQSIGISIHDVNGQFRDFDDVILELGEAWDSVDKNTQRYIATVMAGNRQQSRFLALVSNVQEYKRALEIANTAEGTGDIQTLKTLDSIDAKIERMKVTIQEFYTSSGLEELYKGILDTITNVISAANDLPKAFDKIPVAALAIGVNIIRIIKNVAQLLLSTARTALNSLKTENTSAMEGLINRITPIAQRMGQIFRKELRDGMAQGAKEGTAAVNAETSSTQGNTSTGRSSGLGKKVASYALSYAGAALSAVGAYQSIAAMNKYGSSTSAETDRAAGRQMQTSAWLGIAGDAASGAAMGLSVGGPWGAAIGGVIGGIKGLVTNLASLKSAADMLNVSLAREIELSNKRIEETKNNATKLQGETNALQTAYNKLVDLKEAAYNSAEAMNEYKEYMNQLADNYPELVSALDTQGNKILEVTDLENALAEARLNTARATVTAAEAELEGAEKQKDSYQNFNDALSKIYTTGSTNINVDDIYSALRSSKIWSQTKVLGGETKFSDITDPYEFIVRAYDSAHTDTIGKYQTNLNGAAKWRPVKNANWESIFNHNIETIMDWMDTNDRGGDRKDQLFENNRETFQQALEALKSQNQTLSLAEVTRNANILSADDVLELSSSELVEAVEAAKAWAASNLSQASKVIDTLTKSEFNTKLEEKVLSDAALNEDFKKLEDHTALFNAFSAQLFDSTQDIASEYNKQQIEFLEQWILDNEEQAKALESLDLNSIRRADTDIIHQLTGIEDETILEAVREKYIADTQQVRDDFINFVNNRLVTGDDQAEGVDYAELIALVDAEEGGIAPKLISTLQSQLVNVVNLRNKGYEIAADSYLRGLESLYTNLSNEDMDQETYEQVSALLMNADLQDPDTLQILIKNLEKMGNVPQSIMSSLGDLYTTVSSNIVIQAQQLTDTASDLAESIKKSFDNLGKGMAFADVLKQAQEIYKGLDDVNKAKFNPDDLYRFDSELGQYVLTEQAIQFQANKLTETHTAKVEQLRTDADLQLELLQKLSSGAASGFETTAILSDFLSAHAINDESAEADKYRNLLEGWAQAAGEGADMSEYYENMRTQVQTARDTDLATADAILKNSAISYLASFDFTSIAEGTANQDAVEAQLQVLLVSLGKQATEAQTLASQLYAAALTGNVEELNRILSEAGGFTLSNKSQQAIVQADVQKYLTAIDELTNPSKKLSEATETLLSGADIATQESAFENKADYTNAVVRELYGLLEQKIDGVNYTIEQYNSDIIALEKQTTGQGKLKAGAELLKGGFSLDDFNSFLKEYSPGTLITEYWDTNSHTWTEAASDLGEYLEYDDATDTFKMAAGKDIGEVIEHVAAVLGITIDEASALWQDIVDDEISQRISDLDKADVGKQAASQVSTLAGAKVGTRVAVDKIPEEVRNAMGIQSDDIYEIMSEKARDDMIMAIDANSIDDAEWKAVIRDAQQSISSKRNKSTALQGVLSGALDESSARNYFTNILGMDGESFSPELLQNLMSQRGFVWDAYSQQFKATAEAISWMNDRIAQAARDGADEETLAQMRAQVADLEYELGNGKRDNAVLEALSNYTSASNTIIETLKAAFSGENIDWDSIISTNDDGTSAIDVALLQSALEAIGYSFTEAGKSQIAAVADNYFSAISNAASLASSGLTSQAEIENFIQNYNKTVAGGNLSAADFYYDEILGAFILNRETIDNYMQAQKDELISLGYDATVIDKYIADQTTKQFAAAINLDDFLVEDTTGLTAAKLKQQLKNYLGKDATDATAEAWMNTIAAGGEDAIKLVQQIAADAGTSLSSEDLQKYYAPMAEKFSSMAEIIGELAVGVFIPEGELRTILENAHVVDQATGLVTSVDNLVDAYLEVYKNLEASAGHTVSQLNDTYAKYLTAQDQQNIDTLEALENASGMTYEALGELAASYGKTLEGIMGSSNIERTGFGKIRITDFAGFMEDLGLEADLSNPEFAEAYSNWVDARAELQNQNATLVQSAADQLKGISEAKVGQAINVSYLEGIMGESLSRIVTENGAILENGLLTIGTTTNIPALITEIANTAAEAGQLIPEQLAELADTVASLLSEITSLITGGIGGSLSNVDAQKLSSWAQEQGVSVDFTQTVDGLKLSTESAKDLYAVMQQVDALQATIVFDALKDSLIESDDRFKSISAQTAYMAKTTEEYNKQLNMKAISQNNGRVSLFDELNGNVDMYNRPRIQNTDGTYSTILGATYGATLENQDVHVLLTPIPEWAEVEDDILSTEDLDVYFDALLAENPVDIEALLQLDAEGIEIDGKHINNMLIDIKDAAEVTGEAFNDEAIDLHELSDALEAIKDGQTYDDTKIRQYEQELSLANQIREARSTTEDDSFKFMEQSIPSGQNNPLNYWENWGKAYDAINDAISGGEGKTGYMGYQDFYNLVTEMGNLAELTGQAIPLGENVKVNSENVASLIEQAAGALSNVDGEMKIDLSKIGVDFASSADGMAAGIDDGIHAMAQSQIDMLDGLISLLETIVAMESLGDIDVDGDGIDLTDIFTIETGDDGQTAITGFTEKYETWRQGIIDQITEGNENFNEDLAKAMGEIKIDGYTLAELIKWDVSDWQGADIQFAQGFSDTMAALYRAALSDDYDLDNIADSVKQVLAESGITNLTVDVGETTLVLTSSGVTQIDWNTDITKSVLDQVKEKTGKVGQEAKNAVTTAMANYSNGETLEDYELIWALEMNGKVVIKDGKTTVTWNGKSYGEGDPGYKAALAAWRLSDAGVDLGDDFKPEDVEGGMIETTTTIGSKDNIKVKSDGMTITYESSYTGQTYTSQDALLKGEYAYWQERNAEGKSDSQQNYQSYEEWLFANYNIRVSTKTTFTNESGGAVDIANDPSTRAAVQELLGQSNEVIAAQLQDGLNAEGNYEVTLSNGVTVTLSGDDITVDGNVDGAKVRQELTSQLGLDTALQENITAGIKAAFSDQTVPLDLKISAESATISEEGDLVLTENIEKATGTVNVLELTPETTTIGETTPDVGQTSDQNTSSTNTITVIVDKGTSESDLQDVASAAQAVEDADPSVDTDAPGAKEAKKELDDVTTAANKIPSSKNVTINATNNTAGIFSSIQQQINTLTGRTYEIKFRAKKEGTWPSTSTGMASGNVGNAMAGGNTLMGELGPELVVQNGHYFVAGQQGAEFVNLAPDAIVFNHLQTEQLLKNGMSNQRGRAVTNERVAAAYAHGNVNGGPAMASASAALAALKQLRSMWQSLLGVSVKDLAGVGGSGGGGGGGGNDKSYSIGTFVKELEKWYNWLQKIAELEEEINYQETLRSKIQSDMIAHGQDTTKSYLTSLKALEEEVAVQEDLVKSQQKYFNNRRDYMNSNANPFSTLYTFDENGQLKYQDGALKEMSKLLGTNEYGEANYNAKEQYEKIIAMNPEFKEFMNYDSEGNAIQWYDDEGNLDESKYTDAVQAFWDKVDADKEEMQSLHDSINEHRDAVLEKQQAMNEILKNIEDNQISVENKVLKALEDERQREIDELQKQRDAIEEAANDLIDGLSDQLSKEREMYADQQDSKELTRLQRQLAILQRSGGSAAQISSLQSQIDSKKQDAYFEAQQDAIDALQEATDTEIEKLDEQIDLMQDTLDYEKEHGLLWNRVYEVMQGSPESIANYIAENDSSMWGDSPTKTTQDYREMLYEAQQFTEFRDTVDGGLQSLIDELTTIAGDSDATSGDNSTTTNGNGVQTTSSAATQSKSGSWQQDETGWWYKYDDGSYAKEQWETINGQKYHFDSSGYMQTGWIQDGGKWYFLDSSGAMYKGWLQDQGKWYYLDPSSGEMLANTARRLHWKGEDKHYVFGEDGAWTGQTFDRGGMVEQTGFAMVHAKEGVLTEEQISLLHEAIDAQRDLIASAQLNLQATYHNISGVADSLGTVTEPVIIEHAEVNMNVQQMNNDYDAQRAGDMALEEMLRIARRSRGSNRLGR